MRFIILALAIFTNQVFALEMKVTPMSPLVMTNDADTDDGRVWAPWFSVNVEVTNNSTGPVELQKIHTDADDRAGWVYAFDNYFEKSLAPGETFSTGALYFSLLTEGVRDFKVQVRAHGYLLNADGSRGDKIDPVTVDLMTQ